MEFVPIVNSFSNAGNIVFCILISIPVDRRIDFNRYSSADRHHHWASNTFERPASSNYGISYQFRLEGTSCAKDFRVYSARKELILALLTFTLNLFVKHCSLTNAKMLRWFILRCARSSPDGRTNGWSFKTVHTIILYFSLIFPLVVHVQASPEASTFFVCSLFYAFDQVSTNFIPTISSASAVAGSSSFASSAKFSLH